MANPQVDKITGYYGSLSERWLDRWSRILNEGRAGTYTADAWADDAARTWSDVAASVRFAVDFIDPPVSIAEVRMSITPGTSQVVEAVAIPKPGVALQVTALAAGDNPAVTIAAANVQAFLVSADRLLVVRLQQMDVNPARPLLTPGRQFGGAVHAQGNPGDVKARIILTVA